MPAALAAMGMSPVVAAVEAGAAAVGLLAGGCWYASAWPKSQIFGRTLIAGNDPSEVALTFDDGPNDRATGELLDVLGRYEVRATFFLMGSYAQQQKELARRIAREGHVVGNHTMTHPRLSVLPAARVQQEMAGCSAVLEDVLGQPVRYFRPPFGARRPYVLRVARELGLIPVLWNVTGHDWNSIGVHRLTRNLQKGIARNRRAGRGSNLLLHDGGHLAMGINRMDTVRAVDALLGAPPPGVRFVTVDAWAAAWSG